MSSTNKTTHYEFPQYIGSDIPNILTDINPAFETIDTALYEQGQQITESEADLSTLEAAVTQATSDVTVMQGSIANMAGVLETTRALATDNKETIGQGTLDTVAQTLIGAANELNERNYVVVAEVTADGTKTKGALFKELATAFFEHNNVQPECTYRIAEVTPSDITSYYEVLQMRYLTSEHRISAYRWLIGASAAISNGLVLSVADGNSSDNEFRVTSPSTISFTDKTTDVPVSGTKYQIVRI